MSVVHRASGTVAKNSTTSKTFNFGFTAAKGSYLLVVLSGPVMMSETTFNGWVCKDSEFLLGGGAAIYSWYKEVADGTESSITWTQNVDIATVVAVWEFDIGTTTDTFSIWTAAAAGPYSQSVTGNGTYLMIRADGYTGTLPTTTWTGSGTETIDQSVSNSGEPSVWVSAYEMDHTGSTTLNWGFTPGTGGQTTVVHVPQGPGFYIDDKQLGTYSGAAATSHTFTFSSASAPNSDVIVFGLANASPTRPTNWVADFTDFATDFSFVWRLPGTYNTTGISSITIPLASSQPLVAVAMQDWVTAVNYSGFTTSTNSIPGGNLWGTGLHTYSGANVSYAVFWRSHTSGTFNNTTMASADLGFSIKGNARNNVSGGIGQLMAVAAAPLSFMTSNGVTGTMSVNFTTTGQIAPPGGSQAGMITYTRRAPVTADVVAPTVMSHTPLTSAIDVATTTAVTVTFSEIVTTATITMNRSGTNVPGTVTGTGLTRTFTPSSTLLGSTVYTVVVSGATDPSSNVQSGSTSWSFTTTSVPYGFRISDGSAWYEIEPAAAMPWGAYSTTASMTVASTTTAYPMNFTREIESDRITHSNTVNPERIYVTVSGVYNVVISTIMDLTVSPANQTIDYWMRINDVDLVDSLVKTVIPTITTVLNSEASYIVRLHAGDYFSFHYWGSNTNCRFPGNAAGTSPTRPASPAAVVSINMESV